ncbi:MAG: ParA family protein [Glaciimonas sp.]|nr:ParA family protein [Glaciimonas sp.]
MNGLVYFDDALPVFAALTKQTWGGQALVDNLFLRDANGRLTLVVLDQHSSEQREQLAKEASSRLKVYVDEDFSVATPDELFDDRLKDFSHARRLELRHAEFKGEVMLVDRRLVGADWLLQPSAPIRTPARLVFASIKGGVGRSTALCVLAAHLAAHGKRVLTLDLDLEAPGLGNMLLPGETLPEFGLLDYLVEQHLGLLSEEFFADLVAPSWLGGGKGRVDVIPALGRRSLQHPENVLAKIARAYLVGSPTDGGDSTGFTDHIQRLLTRVAVPSSYDVVLIDARAGLHETAAAAVIGLGAEVLLFGLDQTQTVAGYELLFAHLATLPCQADDDWRERLNLVQAKAPLDAQARTGFAEKMQSLMTQYLWPASQQQHEAADLAALQGEFETEWEDQAPLLIDDSGPPPPIVILDSQRFQSFDPQCDRSTLEERVYADTFSEFLKKIDDILENGKN